MGECCSSGCEVELSAYLLQMQEVKERKQQRYSGMLLRSGGSCTFKRELEL
jgi:hypothetical protein